MFVYPLPEEFNLGQLRQNVRVPPRIEDPNCETNFYSAEVAIHRALVLSPFTTYNPDEADIFLVPVYGEWCGFPFCAFLSCSLLVLSALCLLGALRTVQIVSAECD